VIILTQKKKTKVNKKLAHETKIKTSGKTLATLFADKHAEVSGEWTSINNIDAEDLEKMQFTVTDTNIYDVTTQYGNINCYHLYIGAYEYRLLTQSKIFKEIWLNNIEQDIGIYVKKLENGWVFDFKPIAD